MRTHLITTAAAFLAAALTTTAMPTDLKEWKEAEAAVKHAKEVFARIQAAEPVSTQKIPFDLKDDPMEGTITKRQYENGLTAITLDYVAGDHGGSTEHFYYENKKLVFAFVKDTHWQFAQGSTATAPRSEDTLVERRFYFRDGKCLRALERSATAENAEDLAKLIQKEENREVDERSERAKRLAKTAEGLLIVNRGAMADDFLESVWR